MNQPSIYYTPGAKQSRNDTYEPYTSGFYNQVSLTTLKKS